MFLLLFSLLYCEVCEVCEPKKNFVTNISVETRKEMYIAGRRLKDFMLLQNRLFSSTNHGQGNYEIVQKFEAPAEKQ